MSQPMPVPRQRGDEPTELRPDQLHRRMRRLEYTQLHRLHRLLTRLMVERAIHGFGFEADTLGLHVDQVEDELEHSFAARWSRERPKLLLEEAKWWAEPHDQDRPVYECRTCRLLHSGFPDETIELPFPPRRDRD